MGPGGQAAAAELRAALKDKEKNFQVAAAMALAEIGQAEDCATPRCVRPAEQPANPTGVGASARER